MATYKVVGGAEPANISKMDIAFPDFERLIAKIPSKIDISADLERVIEKIPKKIDVSELKALLQREQKIEVINQIDFKSMIEVLERLIGAVESKSITHENPNILLEPQIKIEPPCINIQLNPEIIANLTAKNMNLICIFILSNFALAAVLVYVLIFGPVVG